MDESGVSNHRFTVVGALCLRSEIIPEVHAAVQAFRDKHNMHGEMKWSKITDQKLGEYQAFADYFFALNNLNMLQFHALIFDNHAANHSKYNNGDRDVGLSKLYYQLMVHKFAKICGPHGDLAVCVDKRNSSTSLDDLRRMVNSVLARDHGMANSPLKQLVPLDSKADDLLQINDVILGAVCAARNGKHLTASGRRSKREMAELILNKSGLASFEENSPRDVHRFSIWNMRTKPR